jgi:hypothetical protein
MDTLQPTVSLQQQKYYDGKTCFLNVLLSFEADSRPPSHAFTKPLVCKAGPFCLKAPSDFHLKGCVSYGTMLR